MTPVYSYLALGDSYTIGESVALADSYPYQAVQLLRQADFEIHGPEIIAKTGWTTSDLMLRLNNTLLNNQYSLVSLLIGVNNQYRGLPSDRYETDFTRLLENCLSLTGKNSQRVFVLSIPDWGQTPYGRGKDTSSVTREIALFNSINRSLGEKHGVIYIDVTTQSPENVNDLSYLSGDGLHPSAKAYARWAKLLANKMITVLRQPT